jgi:cation diffusion facilitator family transporter
MSALLYHKSAHPEDLSHTLSSQKGIRVLKWSSSALLITASLQLGVVFYSQSVALLADTIHNFADAATAIPLWIAFKFSHKKPSQRFTYGYGRIEDLAGVAIVLIILFSALASGYESIHRLIHPQPVSHILIVILASIIGFIGNECVALWRIKTGKEIHSAALIADGEHARIDGLTSLAVLIGAIGTYFGYPILDTLVGIGITCAIFGIVWQSAKTIFTRILDGVEPELIDKIKHTCISDTHVFDVSNIRARWLGHRLTAEINISLDPTLSIQEGHSIAKHIHHQLQHELPMLDQIHIHVDPKNETGDHFH